MSCFTNKKKQKKNKSNFTGEATLLATLMLGAVLPHPISLNALTPRLLNFGGDLN